MNVCPLTADGTVLVHARTEVFRVICAAGVDDLKLGVGVKSRGVVELTQFLSPLGGPHVDGAATRFHDASRGAASDCLGDELSDDTIDDTPVGEARVAVGGKAPTARFPEPMDTYGWDG